MARLSQANFVQGGYYHIYNRGNRKQNIFHSSKDYSRYLEKLKEYKKKHDISILAYCLMPNHIHLLLRQNSPEPVSTLIQKLHTAYSMYYNKKYNQVGHIFQNRFKAKIVDQDEYLMHLSRYIHLNPKKLVNKLPSYKWSSYPSYLGKFNDEITQTSFILNMFKRKKDSQDDAIFAYINFMRDFAPDDVLQIHHLIMEDKKY